MTLDTCVNCGNYLDILFAADKSYVFTVGRVCKESIGNFYLGADVMRWSNCTKYSGVQCTLNMQKV